LVATPSKAKHKQPKHATPKALKHTIAEAGLTDSLQQETVNAQPLANNAIQKILSFVSLDVTQGMQHQDVVAPNNEVHEAAHTF
jgi:hypothetical protein